MNASIEQQSKNLMHTNFSFLNNKVQQRAHRIVNFFPLPPPFVVLIVKTLKQCVRRELYYSNIVGAYFSENRGKTL